MLAIFEGQRDGCLLSVYVVEIVVLLVARVQLSDLEDVFRESACVLTFEDEVWGLSVDRSVKAIAKVLILDKAKSATLLETLFGVLLLLSLIPRILLLPLDVKFLALDSNFSEDVSSLVASRGVLIRRYLDCVGHHGSRSVKFVLQRAHRVLLLDFVAL